MKAKSTDEQKALVTERIIGRVMGVMRGVRARNGFAPPADVGKVTAEIDRFIDVNKREETWIEHDRQMRELAEAEVERRWDEISQKVDVAQALRN